MVTRSLKIMCKIMHESRKKIICSYNRWLHHGWALFQTQNMDLHFFFGSDGSSLLRWTSIKTWIFRPNSEMLNTNVLVDEKYQMRFKDQDTFSRNKLTIKQRRSHIKHHKFRKIKKKISKWVQGSVTVVISEGGVCWHAEITKAALRFTGSRQGKCWATTRGGKQVGLT